MSSPELLIAGHLTVDEINGKTRPGGSAFYAAATAANFDLKVTLLTAVPDDYSFFSELPDVKVINLPSEQATRFYHHYQDEKRQMQLLERATKLNFEQIDFSTYEGVFLGPVAGEINPKISRELAEHNILTGAGLQGWLKDSTGNGFKPVKNLQELKLPWHEKLVGFCSSEDLPGSKIELAEPGQLFVTNGKQGATLYRGKKTNAIPAYPVEPREPTGAGDVFAVGTIIRRLQQPNSTLLEAGIFGAAAASLVVEKRGIRYDFPTKELNQRQKWIQKRIS